MIDTAMHVSAWPDSVVADGGGVALVSVVVTNVSEVIDAYTIEVLGVDPDWITTSTDRLSLFPGESQHVDLTIQVPHGYPAADRPITVTVRSQNDLERFELAEVVLSIPPAPVTGITVDPALVNAGSIAEFGIVVSNTGNTPVRAVGFAVDPEETATFRLDPPEVVVAPGGSEVIQFRARGGRAWFGNPRARVFTLGVEAEQRRESLATFVQRPRIPRWLLALAGLLTAATVFAIVLSRTVDRVVEEASVGGDVLNEALRSGAAGGAVVPANPGSVTGTLTTTTNRELLGSASGATGFQSTPSSALGVAAVQIELFLAADPTAPVASAATDDRGRFALPNLGEGEYLMFLSGAGYPDVWYSADGSGVNSPGDATPIAVELGQTRDLGEIQIGGIPVTVSGKIGGDAAGATLQLVRAGVLDPDVPALLAEVEIGPDGSFSVPDIPSPADLDLIVEKPGFSTVRRKVNLQPGGDLGDISIQLTPADGKVVGRVSGPDGPLGGVTITATDGQYVVTTVSYTDGDVGAFTLRNLSAPGRYTVTAEAEGFVSETSTVTLAANQELVEVPALTLVPATGRIEGAVRVEGQASGDVVITLTGGPGIERTVRPISGDGPLAGTYVVGGLPSPGTYTLTFSSPQAVTQVRVVGLDPFTGSSAAQAESVDLRRELRRVQGTVTEVGGGSLAGATVVLSDGVASWTVPSANDPVGAFAFSDVPPGAYTLTATREGAFATVLPVTVEPGADLTGVTLQLARQASIVGTVDTGGGSCNLVVRLFRFGSFDTEAERETVLDGATYEFLAVPAPVGYLVAVYTAGASDPIATTSVTSTPSAEVTAPTIDVSASCVGEGSGL